jgi:hypothetical protein
MSSLWTGIVSARCNPHPLSEITWIDKENRVSRNPRRLRCHRPTDLLLLTGDRTQEGAAPAPPFLFDSPNGQSGRQVMPCLSVASQWESACCVSLATRSLSLSLSASCLTAPIAVVTIHCTPV